MKKLLRSLMAKNGDTYESLAQKLGIARSTFCNKINGRVLFSQPEMKMIIDIYQLDDHQLAELFFRS